MKAALNDLLADIFNMLGVCGKGVGLEHDLPDLWKMFKIVFHFIDNKFSRASA